MIKQASLYIDLDSHQKLHVRRIHEKPGGIPVFLLHGSIEDGRIFYSKNNKGYGPYLARQGYDVFIPDLRGRGKSTPVVSRAADYGQHEAINEDMPVFIKAIQDWTGQKNMHWAAHSWGGVLMLSYLARYGTDDVLSLITFGSKRQLISAKGWRKWYMLNFGWFGLGKLAIALNGYLPAKSLRMGSDNEPRNMYREINTWLGKDSAWVDQKDGFNYSEAIKSRELPPSLYIAGAADYVLGHPQDVELLRREAGSEKAEFKLLGIENGHSRDYGHIDMLTHPSTREEVFPLALDRMKASEGL